MCDCLKLNLGSFCHLMMNDWADPSPFSNFRFGMPEIDM
jgi:hypothetical protein